jgi:hypothetical protein
MRRSKDHTPMKQTEIKYNYKKGVILINFIIALVALMVLVSLLSVSQKAETYLFIGLVLIILGPVILSMVKSFLDMLSGKHPIVITSIAFTDNINGIKIPWSEISDIRIKKYPFGFYLTISVKNDNILNKQYHNPVSSLIHKLESHVTGDSHKTNISIVAIDKIEIKKEILSRVKK